MDRDDLIEAGAQAWAIKTPSEVLADIIDAVEPLIRADERVKWQERYDHILSAAVAKTARQEAYADLHSKVEALTDTRFGNDWIRRADVLALLDRGQ